MDGKAKESWCMLRCADVAQNNELINRTMLRFRPIAPKPVSSDTVSGKSPFDNKNLMLVNKRSKRKYVRVRKNNGCRRKTRISPNEEGEDGLNKKVVTLQLMPEKTDWENSRREQPCCKNLDPMVSTKGAVVVHEKNLDPKPMWLNFKGQVMFDAIGGLGVSDQRVVMSQRMVVLVESWVTVESVTDTCMDTRGLGSTDVERMNNLDRDTCPGFISDGLNRVQWVNGAYKRMVMANQENGGQSPELMVWLITKEKLPCLYSSFTTTVRLQYTCQKWNYSKMVPCDVFRMDSGGFAWRLDVEAALTLGR